MCPAARREPQKNEPRATLGFFLRGLGDFIPCRSGSCRTLVACQRTEVVCVPLKVDTFQIVLHFKATYAS